MPHEFLAAALDYAALGWRVLPLAPGSKLPAIPSHKGGRGVHDASADPDQLRRWARQFPTANVGLACGEASGFVVIDIDPRNGGDVSIAALGARGHVFPPCPEAATGGGGRHLLFRFDPRIGGSKDSLGRGVDVKSTGGYIVAAPSFVTPKDDRGTGQYRWLRHPSEIAPPRLPIWCSSILAPTPRPAPPMPSRAEQPKSIRPLLDFLSRAPDGERNNRLYWTACRVAELVRSHHVSQAGAVDQLLSTALSRGTPRAEAMATIASAFRKTTQT